MPVLLPTMQKRELEAALRDAGLSLARAKTAVSVFSRFLLERDVKAGRVGFFQRYWKKPSLTITSADSKVAPQ